MPDGRNLLGAGRKIRLRRTCAADVPFLVSLWNNAEVRRDTAWPDDRQVDQAWAERWFAEQQQRGAIAGEHFVVEDPTGRMLGEATYLNVSLGSFEAECELRLLPQAWKDGLGEEVLAILLEYIFTLTSIQVLVVAPRLTNAAARRMYQTVGFKEQHKSESTLVMQVTRDEFFRHKRREVRFNPRIGELTWRDVAGYLRAKDELILPLGSFEQHGPHLPFRTDTLVAEHVAVDLAQQLSVLVAPPLEFGTNVPGHRNYPGQTSVSDAVVGKLVGEILNGWVQSGFRTFYCLSGHGNPAYLEAVRQSCPTGARVFIRDFFDVALHELLEKQTGPLHACEVETSIMLYLRPDLVRMEFAQDVEIASGAEPGPGNEGFPSYATRQKGQELYLLMVNTLKREMKEWFLTTASRDTSRHD